MLPDRENRLAEWLIHPHSVRGDEYYTTKRDTELIAAQLRTDIGKVWCPFDQEWSWFVKTLKKGGWDCVRTSDDFFSHEAPPERRAMCYKQSTVFSDQKDRSPHHRLWPAVLPDCTNAFYRRRQLPRLNDAANAFQKTDDLL